MGALVPLVYGRLCEEQATMKLEDFEVIAESNGHHWIMFRHLVCCRDCGVVRRKDDDNKLCKGKGQVVALRVEADK